jgi:hypothetical protein
MQEAAKFNKPYKGCNDFNVTFFFFMKTAIFDKMFSTLSNGNLVSIDTESTSIPYIVITDEGKVVFSCFMGMPKIIGHVYECFKR